MAALDFLNIWGLSRSFGGLVAVDRVDLALGPGEIRAVIGPNGAGKTTLVGMICGRIAPSSGRILFEGSDITHLPPWRRVERGIVYTFQITSVFRTLSCFDNVALAVQRNMIRGWRMMRPADGARLDASVFASLDRVGLAAHASDSAGSLSYGHQRLLELAMGLALDPRLLILDEPTQGLAEHEVTDFCALVRAIAKDTTILLIEHNMDVVMELADRITVMNNGGVLAEGSPAEITVNTAVQEAYLGS